MRTGSAPPPTDTVSSLAGSSSSSSAVLTSSSSSGSSTSSKTASSSGSGGSSASGAMSPGSFGSVAAWFVLTVDSYLVGFLCRIWVHQTLQLANRGGGCRGVATGLGSTDLVAEAAGLSTLPAATNGSDAVGNRAGTILLRVLAEHTPCHPIPELGRYDVDHRGRVVDDRRQALRGPSPKRMSEIGDDVLDAHAVGNLRVGGHQLDQQLLGTATGLRPPRGVLASGRRELRAPLPAQGFLANAATLGCEARQRIPLEGAPHPSEDASHLLRRLGVTSDRISARSGELLQVCLDERLGGRKARLERLASLRPHEGVGVLASGEECPPTPESRLGHGRKAPCRRPASGLVAVEAGDHHLAQAAEDAELVHGERRAERRDDLLDPGLRAGDRVQIALDHDRPSCATDGLARLEEAVEHLSLPEERRLGGVEVLGGRVGGSWSPGENPPTEGYHLAARVRDRKHQPIAEAIEDAARTLGTVTPQEKPSGDRVLEREVLRAEVADRKSVV